MKLKKVMALVLALALVCTVFAACGTNETSSTGTDSSAAAQPTTTGDQVLTVNAGMEPTGLNTLTSTYAIEFSMFRHLYDNLYMLDDSDVPQPAAAESVDVSEDGMTYTFHMRSDGKWSNGDPVTANDFAFAWQQALNPDVAADYAYFLYFIKNAEKFYKGECAWEEVGVTVQDDSTLVVELENPTPYAPFLFSFGTLCPINQKFYEEVGADNYNKEAEYFCTNGPFKLTEWNHNSNIVMEKNPDFYGADEVYLDKIDWKIISDAGSALTSFLSGELDMVNLSSGDLIQQSEAQGYTTYNYDDGAAFYIYFNHKNEYLQNKNLRKALALGFDKQGMVDTVYQNSSKAMTSFTSPAVNGYDGTSFSQAVGEITPANGDPEAAKGYLDEALKELGCTVEDLSANLSVDCADDTLAQAQAAYYQEQWRQNLGIEVSINPMITKEASANRQNGNYVMSLTGWGPDYNDPMTFLDLWVSDSGNNQTGYSSPEYDDLIAKATVETDLAKRQEYFLECEKLVVEDLPVAPSYWRAASYTYNDQKIESGIYRSCWQDFDLVHVKLK